jgi:hypothetical protein
MKTISILIIACALLATGARAIFNQVFVANHPDSNVDCATIQESKQIGAFVRELSSSEPSIVVSGRPLAFREIWIEHPTLLTYPLVWFPKWKHQDGYTLSIRLGESPIPFRDFWLECDGSQITYFDESDGDRFNIRFDLLPTDPISFRVVDRNTKQTLTTFSLTTKK